jgi:hypothetical protein
VFIFQRAKASFITTVENRQADKIYSEKKVPMDVIVCDLSKKARKDDIDTLI